MERDSNKITVQRRWNKRKKSGKPERDVMLNKMSKAYEIVIKIQNDIIQSNTSDIQAAGKKTDQ